MQFVPQLTKIDATQELGEVDYRLQRRRLLSDIERGVVDRAEACDVHPELLRVARNAAPRSAEDCPLCLKDELRLVAYVLWGLAWASRPRLINASLSKNPMVSNQLWKSLQEVVAEEH